MLNHTHSTKYIWQAFYNIWNISGETTWADERMGDEILTRLVSATLEPMVRER